MYLWAAGIVAVTGTVFVLIVAKKILLPFAVATLVALAFYPITKRLEKMHVPRVLANIIVLMIALVVLIGFGVLFSFFARDFAENIPFIKDTFFSNINELRDWIMFRFGMDLSFLSFENGFSGILSGDSIRQLFSTAGSALAQYALLPLYVFLILFYRDKLGKFFLDITPKSYRTSTKNILHDMVRVAPRYIGGLAIVVSILMVLNSLGLWVIGVENAIFLGVIAALVNLIPYLGTVLGYLFVIVVVFATQDPTTAGWVFILFVIIQFLENNILTPMITGSQVKLNPLMTILAIVAGGAMWGAVGMFIVIPFLAMLKIVFTHVPELHPFAYLLGSEGETELLEVKAIKRKIEKKVEKKIAKK